MQYQLVFLKTLKSFQSVMIQTVCCDSSNVSYLKFFFSILHYILHLFSYFIICVFYTMNIEIAIKTQDFLDKNLRCQKLTYESILTHFPKIKFTNAKNNFYFYNFYTFTLMFNSDEKVLRNFFLTKQFNV